MRDPLNNLSGVASTARTEVALMEYRFHKVCCVVAPALTVSTKLHTLAADSCAGVPRVCPSTHTCSCGSCARHSPDQNFSQANLKAPFFLMPKKVLVSAAFTIFSTRFARQSNTSPTGCIPSVSLHNYRCVKMCMCPRLCPSTHIVVVLDVQTPLQVWDSDWASHWAAHSSTHEYCSLSPPSDTFHPFSSCLPRPIESCLMHCPPAPPYTTAIHTSCVGVSLGVYSMYSPDSCVESMRIILLGRFAPQADSIRNSVPVSRKRQIQTLSGMFSALFYASSRVLSKGIERIEHRWCPAQLQLSPVV